MKVELWGGPHDGRSLDVPPHITELRVRVSNHVARYRRTARDIDGSAHYLFCYSGQDQFVLPELPE